jgi:hypothetical protein
LGSGIATPAGYAMETRAHRIQCLFTEAASEQAAAAGMELHFAFDAGAPIPQVGDVLGFAPTTGSRSRFVVREREFLWEGDRAPGPNVVLLMLDVPDRQWGDTQAEHHRPVEIAKQS